ncbi:MAG: cyclic nucleotide-binding domain-containing protein [Gammaproteobacteria bacterium]|nr:cyclic nucleotide-binding domain-containing protein [Gammaproteobacteria bacterium]
MLKKILKISPIQEIANDLMPVYVFRDLEFSVLEDVAGFSTKRHFFPGDVLISEHQGSLSDIYVLCDGTVEIISSSSGVTSEEVSLSRQDKEIFGEISWLTQRKRTATIRCLDEVDAVCIDGRQFMQYLDDHPEVGFPVMKNMSLLLADRLNEADSLLKQILWNSNI